MSQTSAITTLNTISNQFQNLINLYVVKFINTGDRVADGAFTVILNSLVALLGAFIYRHITRAYYTMHKLYIAKESDEPTAIDHRTFPYDSYTMDMITKYPFVVTFSMSGSHISISDVEKWCIYKYKNIHYSEKTIFSLYDNSQCNEDNYAADTRIDRVTKDCDIKYFMPIWKYKNIKGEWEYIWFCDKQIYSNDYEQLALFSSTVNAWMRKLYEENMAKLASTVKIQAFLPKLYEVYSETPNNVDFKQVGVLSTNRTFDHLYFDCKDHIISMLSKFKTGLYPSGLCLDNKIGILLHGPPGTGKTGTIVAIANHLKRHVIMVKTLNAATIKYLSKLNGNQHTYNYNNSIIVFDEFDHILCQKPAHAEHGLQYKLRQMRESLIVAATDEERNTIKESIKKTQADYEASGDFSMSDLITFLDGMNDATGRVIIATTNHPDKINNTLMRAGRFDLKLELGYCSMQMFKDTVATVYPAEIAALTDTAATAAVVATVDICNEKTGDHIEITQQTTSTIVLIETILKRNITPINLINTLVRTTTFDELLETLMTMTINTESGKESAMSTKSTAPIYTESTSAVEY